MLLNRQGSIPCDSTILEYDGEEFEFKLLDFKITQKEIDDKKEYVKSIGKKFEVSHFL